ncbi:MAG TPA: hypothetical protein PLW43_02465 [Chitinophagales bacterium]|jgi:hypothetical protein|nr:hypothetical protein [Chitinophagales bacterium]
MEQTLTYQRKSLIIAFEKATGIVDAVKIDSLEEAIQIINHLLQILNIEGLNEIDENYIVADTNRDTIKIRFTSPNSWEDHAGFLQALRTLNDYIQSAGK